MSRLGDVVSWMLYHATLAELSDKSILASMIGKAGLFYDNRHSLDDPTKSIYGDDVVYMMSPEAFALSQGAWQTPIQFAAFLIHLSRAQVKTYLDIGCLTGYTITLAAAYLKRFGLETVHAVDVVRKCNEETQELWRHHEIPITYSVWKAGLHGSEAQTILLPCYDIAFIDGDHSYPCVKRDFTFMKSRARRICFHDINDRICTDVVAFWKELRGTYASSAAFTEFTDHPNGFCLMGIGILEWIQGHNAS